MKLIFHFLQFSHFWNSLFKIFAKITSGPLFYQLLVYVVFLALNLLQFDRVTDCISLIAMAGTDFIYNFQTVSELNFSVILNLDALLNQIIFNYITCNYASNVTTKLSSVSDIISNSFWYLYPIDVQKLLPLAIHRSQLPFRLTGYGVITCSMATYLAVCISLKSFKRIFVQEISFHNFSIYFQLFKSAMSYFVVFRKFGG